MRNQVAKTGQISDHYKNLFGADFNPNTSVPTPNQAQARQMAQQVQQTGTVSDHYANMFGINNQGPQMNYIATPDHFGFDSQGRPLTEQDWLASGGLLNASGRDNLNAYKTLDGRYLDTTGWTPQQTYAAQLWDEVNAGRRTAENAMAVLQGMGLDRYGNQIPGYGAVPAPPSASGAGVTGQPSTAVAGVSYRPEQGGAGSPVAPNLTREQLDYFDRYHGGINQYMDVQQARYEKALRDGDEDLLRRLREDAARIGYTLRDPGMQPQLGNQPIGGDLVGAQPNFGQLTPDQIQREADYRMGRERADLQNAVDSMIANILNDYQYATQNIQDQRVLEDAQIGRSVNPFSGRASHLQAQIARGRQIDDTTRSQGLQNELTRIRNDLYNFDRLAPERRQALINEMTRIERDYGLQVGELTGNFNGQRTLAGQMFDWQRSPENPAIQSQNLLNRMAQIELDALPEQTRLNLESLRQQVQSGQISLEQAQWQLNELIDPNSITNRKNQIELEMLEIEARNLPEKERLALQQLRKTIEQIGKRPAMTESEKQMEQIKLEEARIRLEQLKNPQPEGQKPYQFNTTLANSIRQQAQAMGYLSQGDFESPPQVTNPNALRNMIIASGSSEQEIDALLAYFGLN